MIRRFQAHGLRVGEVLYAHSKIEGKPKYHLCVKALDHSDELHFVMLNTGREKRRKPGRLVVPHTRVLLPRPKTGLTEFDMSMIRPCKRTSFGQDAVVYPSIGRCLAADLAEFVEWHVKTYTRIKRLELIKTLLSITADDPDRDMHQRLRRYLHRTRQPRDPVERQKAEATVL